jgi:hypothetical protein
VQKNGKNTHFPPCAFALFCPLLSCMIKEKNGGGAWLFCG